MLILNINGPINSGKSTVSKILVQQLKSACFIEVDDLLSDEERHVLGLNREEGWRERIRRLQEVVRTEKRKKQYENIIFAYPMTGKLFNEWKNWEDKNTKFINITLATPIEICIGKRGERSLSEAEVERIKEMYREGYHNSKYADLIIDNGMQTPQETAGQILLFLKDK